MAFVNCEVHQSPQNVICWESPYQSMLCEACFSKNNELHHFGVLFNEYSCAALLKWNEYLLEKIRDIRSIVLNKGYNFFFVMRLDSSFPRNLIGEISKVEIQRIALQILKSYEETLQRNINYMATASGIVQLNVPDFQKDLYRFFVQDTTNYLKFLIEDLQKSIREAHPQKKIYEFTYFVFLSKEISQIEAKRRGFIKEVEDEVIVKLTHVDECYSPSMKKTKVQETDLHQGLNLMDITKFILSFQLNKIEEPEAERKSQGDQNFLLPILQPYIVPQPKIESVNILELQNLMLRNELEKAQQQLNLKQKSICELNKLINNEEQELLYRQNEVELLTAEVRKLIDYKQKYEIMEKRLEEERKIIDLKDKNIKELNNVIENEEEELAYRESEVEGLMSDLRKIIAAKNVAEEQLKASQPAKLQALSKENENLKAFMKRVPDYEGNQGAWDQLITQTVELEAAVVLKDRELEILIETINEVIEFAPAEKQEDYRHRIQALKDVALKR